MQMISVSSSAMSAVGYNPDTGHMKITFTQGHTYDFCRVPQHVYEGKEGSCERPPTWQATRTYSRPAFAGLWSARHFYVGPHHSSAAGVTEEYYCAMQVATGTVVNGKIELEGVALPEGSVVTVVARGADEPFSLSASEEDELLEAIAEIERGEFISVEELLESLPK
jgi:hypothetical protein